MTDTKKASPKAVPSLHPTSFTEVSRIHRGMLSDKKGSVVVTSTSAGEGSSLITQLMAQRSAENGKRTLLIDLNMKDSSVSESLGIDRSAWNLPARTVTETLPELVHPVEGVKNMFVMSAPLDVATVQYLKNMQNAKNFFEVLEGEFDQVIVDTTAVSLTNRYNVDPVILGSASHSTVIVMMAAHTPKERLTRAIKQLREAGANIEGVVVNDVLNPSLKERLYKLVDFFKPVAPGFSIWMRDKINKHEGL